MKRAEKKEKRPFLHSIRGQFAVVCFLLILGTILLCLLVNTLFLGAYYEKDKQRTLMLAYAGLEKAASGDAITSEAFDVELVRLTSAYNIGVIVIDGNSKTLKCYATDPAQMSKRLWENLFGGAQTAPGAAESANDTQILRRIRDTELYHLQVALDLRTNTEYMELWGFLSDGNLFLIRAAMEGIRSSVRITNRFMVYVGVGVALFGAVAAMAIAGRMTRPVRELTNISERMKRLDFNAKYSGGSRSELGALGENINELSEALESTISELKTANNELRRDIEQREKMDGMRKEFLSNVSHELKTPIALIQGYAEGLQDCVNDDAESREFYCGVIIDEAARMNNMVQKLLTLNQLEFGSETVTMERFDIVEVVRNYLSSAALLAQQQGVTVRMEQQEPLYVWADEFLAEEVFTNYFSNALHHAAGDKVVDIRFERKQNCVRVSVFNTGAPIPEESLPHLWEKFYKVDKARSREYGGSGIGLSIVRAVMDALHQSCGVQNYDDGVAFWFELDARLTREAEQEQTQPAVEAVAGTAGTRG